MSSEPTAMIRLVRCPKCRQVLLESSDVPVYACGGCGTRLQAKYRNNNAHGGAAPGLQENATAQTSNSDPSPEGMDRSHKTVAGDCNSKQLTCEDENRRVDQNGPGRLTSMQPLDVNLLKDRRSGQNGSAMRRAHRLQRRRVKQNRSETYLESVKEIDEGVYSDISS